MQHIASGLGAYIGGVTITQTASGRIEHFGRVGWIAVAATLVSIWLAGRICILGSPAPTAESISLAAAAEATADSGETLIGSVED